MIQTRSSLSTLIFGLCCTLACSQKDPNDGTDTDTTEETDTSDTTKDTTDESSSAPTSNTSSGVAPNTTAATDDSSDSTDVDTTDANEPDAGTTDETETTSDSTNSDSSDSSDETDDSDDVSKQICPMVAGATWTYQHNGWTEVQTVSATTYEGEPAFVVKDTPNPKDSFRSDSVHVKRDGRLLRLYKDQFFVSSSGVDQLDSSATYGVGFLRCDEAWASKEPGWNETPEYIRIETNAGDTPKAPEERSHTFTVEGREDVSTSSGKAFNNCVKVRRSKDWEADANGEDAQEKLYWFCPGVGKVREQNVGSGNVEELLEYSIPK